MQNPRIRSNKIRVKTTILTITIMLWMYLLSDHLLFLIFDNFFHTAGIKLLSYILSDNFYLIYFMHHSVFYWNFFNLYRVGWIMLLNATFNNISVICGSQFYWWRKPEKTTSLPQVTDKLSFQVCPWYSLHQLAITAPIIPPYPINPLNGKKGVSSLKS